MSTPLPAYFYPQEKQLTLQPLGLYFSLDEKYTKIKGLEGTSRLQRDRGQPALRALFRLRGTHLRLVAARSAQAQSTPKDFWYIDDNKVSK